ncbi:hypothetical protein ASG52_21690 [Methylobacterium sp. Leaf456]|nr:hypothetical protein ASG52_21690 [Methylobacterium sp. Leaf456]
MRPILPDHPSGAALLDVARRALLDEVAPTLTGRQRYVTLMVANSIGIAMREIERADETAESWDRALATLPQTGDDPLAALVAAIRAGAHDGDAALHAALQGTTTVAAEIWKPAAKEAKAGA